MKTIFRILILCFCTLGFSQVGIGTTNPNATLDIRSSNQAGPANTDGILIPKVDVFPTGVNANQDAMLVYLTTTVGTDSPGFYYYNHATTTWLSVGGSGSEKIDDLLDGRSDASGSSIFFGINAGSNDDSTDNRNVGIGFQSLSNATNAYANVAVGVNTMNSTTLGNYNTALGYASLFRNIDGSGNIAIGSGSLYENLSGVDNVSVGNNALRLNTTGFQNTAIGTGAMYSNTTGAWNLAVGYSALRFSTAGNQNTALGYLSLTSNTSGSYNSAVGFSSLLNNSTGNNNVAVGNSTLQSNIDGNNNVAIGDSALTANTSGSSNTALGRNTLQSNASGSNNTAIGSQALYNNTADYNSAVGVGALFSNTTGSENTALGYAALSDNTTSSYNTGIGNYSLASNTDGTLNTAVGSWSMNSTSTGFGNTALGAFAMSANQTGIGNVALGSEALFSNVSGHSNVAIGISSLYNSFGGDGNVAIGFEALYQNLNNGNNVAIGSQALRNNSGVNNTVIGYSAGINCTGSYNVLIGNEAGSNETGNDKLYIANSNADANNALIYGEFGNDLLRINGRTEITATTDASGTAGSGALEIANSLRLDGNEIITNTGNVLYIQSDNNGDVEMDGGTFRMDASTDRVGIGTATPQHRLSVFGTANLNEGIATGVAMRVNGDEALWYNGTYFSWGFGGTANYFADNIGIGTATPATRLQVAGNLDTSLTNHGLFVLGDVTGVNISMDANEIMARNNGGTSNLNLQVDGGNVTVGGAIVHASDRRLKKDIEDLQYSLEELLVLQPKQYNWKRRTPTKFKSFGLIAQEIQKIMPELVLTSDDKSKTLSVNYTELIPVLINAIQEQQEIINDYKKELSELAIEVQTIKKGIQTLKAETNQ